MYAYYIIAFMFLRIYSCWNTKTNPKIVCILCFIALCWYFT